MAFAAGVLLATALADLLPEAAELLGSENPSLLAGVAAVGGFLLFSAIEGVVHRQSMEHQGTGHSSDHDEGQALPTALGLIGPVSLIIHSTLDGLAIGLGFRASTEIGLLVAFAVLAHDFADGMNVVTLSMAGGVGRAALVFLLLDALAPALGSALGAVIPMSDQVLGTLLGAFAGVFIAIGAGHLLPEVQHDRLGGTPLQIALTSLGAGLVLLVRGAVG